jgi:hypothetical protein
MWEAPYREVVQRLGVPGSKARNERGALGVLEFKKLKNAKCVWREAIPKFRAE